MQRTPAGADVIDGADGLLQQLFTTKVRGFRTPDPQSFSYLLTLPDTLRSILKILKLRRLVSLVPYTLLASVVMCWLCDIS